MFEQSSRAQRLQRDPANVRPGVGDMRRDLFDSQWLAHTEQRQHEKICIGQAMLVQRAPKTSEELEVGAPQQITEHALRIDASGSSASVATALALRAASAVATRYIPQRRAGRAVVIDHFADEDHVVP